jgi:uncharacterized membrane protein
MEMTWDLAVSMVLRWLHVLGAIFWFGFFFYMTFVQAQVLEALAPPQKRQLMLGLVPGLSRFMTGGAILAVLSGLALGHLAPRNPPADHDWLGWGIYLGLLMFALGMFVSGPTARRVLKGMREGLPPTQKDLRLLGAAGVVNTYLSFPAVFLMVAGSGHFSEPLLPWVVGAVLVAWTLTFILLKISRRVLTKV